MTNTTQIPATEAIAGDVRDALATIGVPTELSAGARPVRTPITGGIIAGTPQHAAGETSAAIDRAHQAFLEWRSVPAPVRGNVVKRWGELLVQYKSEVAAVITAEAGKIPSEAAGEVQEIIDVIDLAVGQSRQLYGKTVASERPGHRLAETWHPLGVVGIITAFNFPVAVYGWNTALALVAGDTVVWKPAAQARLAALAVNELLARAVADSGAPSGLHHLVLTDRDGAAPLLHDARVRLVSATGSVRLGREIAPILAGRFARTILELGGNNAAVVAPSADLDLALRGIVFAAVGTAGQRCTSLRRLIVHSSIAGELIERLSQAYRTLQIGAPGAAGVLVGPLIDRTSFEAQQQALAAAQTQGGEVIQGGDRVLADAAPDAYYVEPAIVRVPGQVPVVHEETFAPLLYVMEYDHFDDAIALNNEVPQGLSAAIFTQDQAEAERFVSAVGADTGIANVNIGTSGAEVGGAFGGEKETGGGRESGTDSWKAYARQATNTINFSGELPLAQGVKFF